MVPAPHIVLHASHAPHVAQTASDPALQGVIPQRVLRVITKLINEQYSCSSTPVPQPVLHMPVSVHAGPHACTTAMHSASANTWLAGNIIDCV
jgi:hypothetical protein